MKLYLTSTRLAQQRIEQNQCRVMLSERKKRHERGQGMKDADCRFSPIDMVVGLENEVVIVNQRRNIVIALGADAIPAMVPEVLHE